MPARLTSGPEKPALEGRLSLDPADALTGICIVVSLGLWIVSLPLMDPDALDAFGIASILPWQYWAAVALLSAGFAINVGRPARSNGLRITALLGLILMLHATPAIVYGILRYSWAWKHIGIVDFIMRHGDVDRTITFLSAYHNWPGFFRVAARLAEWLHLGPLEIANAARFFPVLANMSWIFLLRGIYRRFTRDERLVHASIWVFVCANWVGQDYFSPQALAYFLYLLALLLCLGPIMPAGSRPEGALGRRISAIRGRFCRVIPLDPAPGARRRILAVSLLALTIYAIAATHQLTPIILLFALSTLAVTTPLGIGYPILAGLIMVFWVFYPASPFTSVYLPDEVANLGRTVGAAVTGKLVDTSKVGLGTAVVVWAGRLLTVGMVLLAGFGALRRLWNGEKDGVLWALLIAPGLILGVTSYGGEAIFRIFFFSLPFVAFCCAGLFFSSVRAGAGVLTMLTFWMLSIPMILGFILANNGKDQQYRFSPDEVEAAYWLYSRAGPDTLLVEGARNYPSQFMNYENFFYLPIANEAASERAEILAAPAETLDRWFSDARWQDGYVILTRSQTAYVETLGIVPEGSYHRLALALMASPDFVLVHANRDAQVFRSAHFVGGLGLPPDAEPPDSPVAGP